MHQTATSGVGARPTKKTRRASKRIKVYRELLKLRQTDGEAGIADATVSLALKRAKGRHALKRRVMS
jgi:hypothetical protein